MSREVNWATGILEETYFLNGKCIDWIQDAVKRQIDVRVRLIDKDFVDPRLKGTKN